MVRVRSSDPSISPQGANSDSAPVGPADPNTVVSGARSTFIPGETPVIERGKLEGTAPIVSRTWAAGDPILKRHMTEVLIRALGVTMAQIDEPNAGADQPPPSGKVTG